MPNMREFTMSFDVYVKPDFQNCVSIHWHDLITTGFNGDVGPDYSKRPEYKHTQVATMFQISSGKEDSWGLTSDIWTPYSGTLGIYYYTTEYCWRTLFFNPSDPTSPYEDEDCLNATPSEVQTLLKGEWQNLKVYVKANTPGTESTSGPWGGNADGILQAWHNGQLMIDIHNMEWISPTGYANGGVYWNVCQFHKWFGTQELWASMADQAMYYDNFVIEDLT
jgi:hypothetical protein